MKIHLFSLLLAMVFVVPALSGCQAARSAGRAVERGVESAGNAGRQAIPQIDRNT